MASARRQSDPGPSWLEDVKAHRDRHSGAGQLDAHEAYEVLAATGPRYPPAQTGVVFFGLARTARD